MALRIARGLFRLWLVLSVLWIGGVAVVTWRTFPPEIPERRLPYLCELNKDCSWLDRAKRYWSMILEDIEEFPPWERSEIETIRFATLSASLLALIPPA